MIHNDVLRSVRYMLDISDKKVIEITKTGGMEIALEDLLKYLDKKEEDEEGFVRCPDEVIAHFLDGLVIFNEIIEPGQLVSAEVIGALTHDLIAKVKSK